MNDTELKAKIVELEEQIVCSETRLLNQRKNINSFQKSMTKLQAKLNHAKKLQRYKIDAGNSYTTDSQGDFILYSDLNAAINE